jgi:hypothetical protein
MGCADARADFRLTFYCEARIDGLDVARSLCRVADLGVGGAFVEARTVLPPGARTTIGFSILGQEIRTAAEVRYALPGIGMGLRFVNLPEIGEMAIRTLIRRESEARRPAASES